MSSPSPTVFLISNPQPVTTISQPPISTLAFCAFINQISDTVRSGLSQRRPWAELADCFDFAKSKSFSEEAIIGLAIVSAHGSFRVLEDLFLDDQEPSVFTGFVFFLGGAASNAAAASVPLVDARF